MEPIKIKKRQPKKFQRDGCDGFDFLIGKKIIDVSCNAHYRENKYDEPVKRHTLTCDDGTTIYVTCNEGCGGCLNGWSEIDLMMLKTNDNVITNVKAVSERDDVDEYFHFRLFVYYADNRFVEIEGDDGYGNGFYGGGFWIEIEEVEQ